MAEAPARTLTHYASVRAMAEWLAAARPAAEMIYASGPALDPREGAAMLVAGWVRDGAAISFQRRDPVTRGLQYFVRKSVLRDAPRGAPQDERYEGARLVEFDPDSPEGRVLAVLRRCANLGQPCPSNDTLADLLDLKDRAAAGYRVRVLAKAGLIRIDEPARFGARVVTIVSSGRSTAAPDTGAPKTGGQGGRAITREISA